jgi:hypothetical protein
LPDAASFGVFAAVAASARAPGVVTVSNAAAGTTLAAPTVVTKDRRVTLAIFFSRGLAKSYYITNVAVDLRILL